MKFTILAFVLATTALPVVNAQGPGGGGGGPAGGGQGGGGGPGGGGGGGGPGGGGGGGGPGGGGGRGGGGQGGGPSGGGGGQDGGGQGGGGQAGGGQGGGATQVCTNDAVAGRDFGCPLTTPICADTNGGAISNQAPGQSCVPCMNSNPFRDTGATDDGCSAAQPWCVENDGMTDAPFNAAGTQCIGDTPPPLNGDLGIRFNKFTFSDGTPPNNWQTLTQSDYPIGGTNAAVLAGQTNAASVMVLGDYQLEGRSAATYINTLGGFPTYPGEDAYWPELEFVVDMQLHRRSGGAPSAVTTLPDIFASWNIMQFAEAVHDEYPGSLQVELIKQLWNEGVELDYSIMPRRSENDFVRTIVGAAAVNNWAIIEVSPLNFHAKWSGGRPRPEEVVWMIYNDELTTANHGVPESLVTKIKGMNLMSAPDFTAYPEGSPTHPSWPAMHSAASSASFWLTILYNLTPDQICQARRVDYAVSFARTVAGVHYVTDNIMGLNLGQEIMSQAVTDYLVNSFGADAAAVQNKINQNRFDWNNFDVSTCSI